MRSPQPSQRPLSGKRSVPAAGGNFSRAQQNQYNNSIFRQPLHDAIMAKKEFLMKNFIVSDWNSTRVAFLKICNNRFDNDQTVKGMRVLDFFNYLTTIHESKGITLKDVLTILF